MVNLLLRDAIWGKDIFRYKKDVNKNSWKLNRENAIGFLSVTAFCLAIALLLFGLGVTSPFVSTLVISLSIGWSISGVSFLFAPWLDRRTSPGMTAFVLTPIGVFVGLVSAGLISHGEAFAYLGVSEGALILGFFFAVIGYLIFEARSRLLGAREELERVKAAQVQQEKALLSSELKLLQAQIEPHFLFNTLSNVIGLVHNDPDAAEETLVRLTTLLRSSLDRTRQQSTSLREELEIVDAYLGIQNIRMPHRLSYRFVPALLELDESLLERRLPPLLLQPLVENAIQHGIDPLEDGGEIEIQISGDQDQLFINVADTGQGVQSSNGSSGTGLANVRERLNLLYGDRAELQLEENQPQGVIVRLAIQGEPS